MGKCGFDLDGTEKGYRMPQPSGCPDSFYKLILQCRSQDAENEPRFSALELTLYVWNNFSEPFW